MIYNTFEVDLYSVKYSNTLITISKGGYYITIDGKEAVIVFDVFTDFCSNVEQIDLYFEVSKLKENPPCT